MVHIAQKYHSPRGLYFHNVVKVLLYDIIAYVLFKETSQYSNNNDLSNVLSMNIGKLLRCPAKPASSICLRFYNQRVHVG